jgi:argininosuccinate lyase
MKKMWEGRFDKHVDFLMEQFNRSLLFDIRLYAEDIQTNKAYALALQKAGILTKKESAEIRKTLDEICVRIENGKVKYLNEDEDIHMLVERLLTEKTGASGAKIHTGRSRNDQVATDTRLYVKKCARRILLLIADLQRVLLLRAKEEKNTILPGYTHMQQAQPISLAHYLMSFFFCLERDKERFKNAYKQADVLPLGSGAIAGSGFPLDRNLLAQELGFSAVSDNSVDAISDRDFILDFLYACSALFMHLSRYAEDLIVWSTSEFGFVELSDLFSTGSSMMPQKKNPDSLELIRGKTGRIYGNLTSLLTVMKGLPLTYAKDMQEDKESLFDSVDTAGLVLPVMTGVFRTLLFHREKMQNGLSVFMLATDIADHLTKTGLPFRAAHEKVGKLTRFCLANKKNFQDLTEEEIKLMTGLKSRSFFNSLTFEQSIKRRDIYGGTGPHSLDRQMKKAGLILKKSGSRG